MRTTTAQLERLINRINSKLNTPLTPWTRTTGVKANIGNIHLTGAYGGYKVEQMTSESGSTTDVLNSGYVSKRELYALLNAFLADIEMKEVEK